MTNRRILIIDDDHAIQDAYRAVLDNSEDTSYSQHKMAELLDGGTNLTPDTDLNFHLTFADQGHKGLLKVQNSLDNNTPFALACIDIRMPPGWDGMETATKIRQIDPNIEIVIVTAYADRSRKDIVQSVGAPDKLLFLKKPFDPEELQQLALALTEKWNLARQSEKQQLELKASEERFRSLVETTSDWVWEIDKEGRLTYCSPLSTKIYNYPPEKLLGRFIFDSLSTSEAKDTFKDFIEKCTLNRTEFKNFEHHCKRKDGEVVYIESSGVPIYDNDKELIGFRGIDRDITERKNIEEKYRQSQRMEALGTLAGGIAHDFNNVLTPIIGTAQLSLFGMDKENPLYENLQTIHDGAKKASSLVRQILAFSRKQLISTKSLNLNDLIKDFSKMLQRLIREDIELHIDLAEDLDNITADPSQIEQILINLVVNARDAISKNGEINIRTRNANITDNDTYDINHNLLQGQYIELLISDNGSGINKKILSRIFDPFYTTKDVDKGTGMGLSTVYGIVSQHKGHIKIETSIGQGTSFHLFFRKSDKEAETKDENSPSLIKGGNETILVVEDNLDVRAIIIAALNHYGYNVFEASNGKDALRLFDELDRNIDLLLTDIIMPRIGGLELAKEFQSRQPDLPVIFMSGHPQDTVPMDLIASRQITFIEKPFNPQNIALKIRLALDEHAAKLKEITNNNAA